LSVGAIFKNQSAADGAASRSDEIAQAAAQVVGSVVPLISMASGAGLGNLSCLEPCNRACLLSKKPCPVTLSKIFQKNESLLTGL
jgi:hypothetical protein